MSSTTQESDSRVRPNRTTSNDKIRNEVRSPKLPRSTECVILDPMERMQILYRNAKVEIDRVDDIPFERFLDNLRKMIPMADSYVSDGQPEKAFMLYMRFVTVFVDELPNHKDFNHLNLHRANEDLVNSTVDKANRISSKLKDKYLEEAIQLFNHITETSPPPVKALILQKSQQSTADMTMAEIVKSAREEAERIHPGILDDDVNKKKKKTDDKTEMEKCLAIPSNTIKRYLEDTEEDEDIVGVLFGTNPYSHYFVVSHLVIPGSMHTSEKAHLMAKSVISTISPLGLIPLGVIHRCKQHHFHIEHVSHPPHLPSSSSTKSTVSYSSCDHLYAQAYYQTEQSLAVSINVKPSGDISCVNLTAAGFAMATKENLDNVGVTIDCQHVKFSDGVSISIVDMRGTNEEIKYNE